MYGLGVCVSIVHILLCYFQKKALHHTDHRREEASSCACVNVLLLSILLISGSMDLWKIACLYSYGYQTEGCTTSHHLN